MQQPEVLFESNQLLIINKPSGMISEQNPIEALTAESMALAHVGSKIRDPYVGVVHRLDRVTSGVLLFAKKRSVLKQLNQWFTDRKIQKTYLALVDQAPPKETGNLEHYLETDQKAKKAVVRGSKTAASKLAKLTYSVVEKTEHHWLIAIKPTTGRFHQIRAQLAYIGCPIIGDTTYGGTSFEKNTIALHAWKIELPESINASPIQFEAPLPSTTIWKNAPSQITF